MRNINATLSILAVALWSLIFCGTVMAQQPPDNVQGNWTIYSTNVDNGETVVKHVQIAQYGDRITGYFEGPNQSGPIEGRVDVYHVMFSTVTRNVLTFRGQIYGDNMSGEYGIHGKHAPWQAERMSGGPQAVPQPAVSYSQPVLVPPTSPETYATPTYQQAPAQNYPQYQQAPAQNYPQQAPAYSSYSTQTATSASTTQGYAPPVPAPLNTQQLDALVAPIALYPDSLVAQVLAAATVPDEVSQANSWLSQNTNLTGANLAQAVDQQSWDPSVKALTQFPSVLASLANNLTWASNLGQAFENQQPDVMAAVQVMRAKAQAAGTLQSNGQITVTTPNPGVIVIQPTNPQVVYVPQYNPTVVYGAPFVVPFYTPSVAFASATVSFGAGISVGGFFGGGAVVAGGGWGWGWHAWGCNWGGGGGGSTIIYNHNTYIHNNTWNNTNYNGYHPWANGAAGSQNHAWYASNGTYHPDGNYRPGQDTHYGPNGAYHPNGYFGPDGGWHPDKPGTGPANVPNGGHNGDHGLIGGNGGVRNPDAGMNGPGVAPKGGYHNGEFNHGGSGSEQARSADHDNRSKSRMSGDGRMNRVESNRGRGSMAGRRPEQHQQHVAREHAPAEHHSSGGGGRRR